MSAVERTQCYVSPVSSEEGTPPEVEEERVAEAVTQCFEGSRRNLSKRSTAGAGPALLTTAHELLKEEPTKGKVVSSILRLDPKRTPASLVGVNLFDLMEIEADLVLRALKPG